MLDIDSRDICLGKRVTRIFYYINLHLSFLYVLFAGSTSSSSSQGTRQGTNLFSKAWLIAFALTFASAAAESRNYNTLTIWIDSKQCSDQYKPWLFTRRHEWCIFMATHIVSAFVCACILCELDCFNQVVHGSHGAVCNWVRSELFFSDNNQGLKNCRLKESDIITLSNLVENSLSTLSEENMNLCS